MEPERGQMLIELKYKLSDPKLDPGIKTKIKDYFVQSIDSKKYSLSYNANGSQDMCFNETSLSDNELIILYNLAGLLSSADQPPVHPSGVNAL